MKLILYSWNANNEQILADNLLELGFDVVWFRKACQHYTRDMELAMEMIQALHREAAEAVVSFNFFPIVSMVCQTCKIPYYAWVYDCPHFTLYAKQVGASCNHIGVFDRGMARHMAEDYGIDTVYHAPLAVDTAYFGETLARASKAERDRYRCDVSFVGSLYTDEHNYYDLLFAGDRGKESVPCDGCDRQEDGKQSGAAAERECVEALVRQQCFVYDRDYFRQAVCSETLDLSGLQRQMEEQGLMLGEDYFAKPEDILVASVLEKKVTVEERKILLTELIGRLQADVGNAQTTDASSAGRAFDFRLYTGSHTENLPKLHACNHGTVDYHTQMPLVFAGSCVNLNISLRSIHSGIPLRVLDIMACGGFVLSNRQPEIAEYFEEGVEIATFDSMEECMDKVQYYLTHEKERQQIAEAGFRKVQQAFSYREGLERLLGV